MSWERACSLEDQLSEEVAELLEMAEEVDEQVPGEHSLPDELTHRRERLEQIKQAKAMITKRADQRYEAEKASYEKKMAERAAKQKETGKTPPGRKPKPPEPGPRAKDQVNFTDPESRIMLTSSHGWQQAYNVQAGVDMDSYMLVGGYVSQAPNDKNQVKKNLNQIQALPDQIGSPKRITADAGYFSKDNVNVISEQDITPYISTNRQTHHPSLQECLRGAGAPPEDPSPVEMNKWRLKTKEGKDFYSRRKSTIEPIFGIIKEVLGFRQFLHRGIKKVTGEWNLVQCAYNLKRMHALAG